MVQKFNHSAHGISNNGRVTPNISVAAEQHHCASPSTGHTVGSQIFIVGLIAGFVLRSQDGTLSQLQKSPLKVSEILCTCVRAATEARINT